eukprot:1381216-Rhodomonas_salina.1
MRYAPTDLPGSGVLRQRMERAGSHGEGEGGDGEGEEEGGEGAGGAGAGEGEGDRAPQGGWLCLHERYA